MKLHKLIVKNFRSIKGDNNVICFDKSNIIFLIGQNNVGKSSFLHAYDFFVNSKQCATEKDFHNYDTSTPIEIEAWFTKEIEDENDSDLSGTGKSKEPDWINKWVDAKNIIKIKKVWDTANSSFKKYTFSPNSNSWEENGFGGFHTKLQKYSPKPIFINAIETPESFEKKINDLINDKFLKELEKSNKDEYEKITQSIIDLQKKITSSSEVNEFNEKINIEFQKVFSNLTLQIKAKDNDGVNILKAFEKNHSIGIQKDGIERDENFTQHGHGVIRQALFNFLKFLGSLGNDSTTYLILFEEPEIFLHPKVAFNLRKSLYELSKDSQYQILCATHSPLMIDISMPHSSLIRVIKDKNENTEVFQVNDGIFQGNEEKKQLVQMINKFNPHICEAFYADKVLLVEGDTETIVYREILSNFYPNEEIFVLNTGSKTNIPFFQEILTHFKIEHYIIHDSDTEKRKDGNNNSAWALNQTIWEKVEKANIKKSGLSRRYLHIENFESANNYQHNPDKGKPLSAYAFAKTIEINQDIPCLNWLRDITGNKEINHDQNYLLEAIKKA
ncbi:MAG TPA: AAA family ATPase [Gammaproteobacteria bacterium]|nr:AAA family ATPase [Gammaproteobacteria bacterium]